MGGLCTLAHRGAGPPLVLLPAAGATPLALVRLARALPPHHEVCSFGFAGLEGGTPHREIETMAGDYLAELQAYAPGAPCSLAGYCFGGLVACAMAARLEAAGQPARRLVLLEATSPPRAAGPQAEELREQLRLDLSATFRAARAQLAQLPRPVADRLEQLLRLHVAAGDRFQPRPLQTPTVLLRSRSQPAALFRSWRTLCAQLEERVLDLDSSGLLVPPGLSMVAAALASALE